MKMQCSATVAGLVMVVLTACGGGSAGTSSGTTGTSSGSPGTSGSPTQAPTPAATSGPALTLPALKLALVNTYGPLWYCDPDFFPVQRGSELDSARARWAEVTADASVFKAIAVANRIDPGGPFTDQARLIIYRAWKAIKAIALNPIGSEIYRFDYLAQPGAGASEGTRTRGTITASGAIVVQQQAAATQPNCPICLARGTRIDGPLGGIAVEDLRIGDPVWTVDTAGNRAVGSVLVVGSTVAPVNHRVVRLVLADGRTVTASPGHPLADGRLIGALHPGDIVGGSTVTSADLVAYDGGSTYDLIVSGPTGTYLVDGIPLGSTLRR